MLNFEDARKTPEEGYVVLPVSAYTEMLSRLHLLEEHLLTVEKAPYNDSIEVYFNKKLIHELASKQMQRLLGAEELQHYDVVAPDELSLYSSTLATRKPDEPGERDEPGGPE